MAQTVRLIALLVVLAATAMTTAAPTLAADLVFAVFGDSRPGPNYERLDITRRLAQDIASSGAEFLLGTGDYIEGSTDPMAVRAQYQRFFEALLPLKHAGVAPPSFEMPVALATGNHDIRGSIVNARIFEEYFGGRRYGFEHAGSHFIILDSEVPGQEGTIRGDQWQWLMEELEQAKDARFIFVALHRPLFPTGPHMGSSMDVDVPLRDRLHALFVKHKVSAVFAGHEHLYHHSRRDNIDYFITGGGGAPLYARPSEGGFYHYLLVTIEAGNYTVQVRPLGGS